MIAYIITINIFQFINECLKEQASSALSATIIFFSI